MWCWRRMGEINWTDHVRNEVLQRIKDDMNILQTIKTKKANWIGQTLHRNGLSKTLLKERHVEGNDGKKRKKT
jgi:hypothetical protein